MCECLGRAAASEKKRRSNLCAIEKFTYFFFFWLSQLYPEAKPLLRSAACPRRHSTHVAEARYLIIEHYTVAIAWRQGSEVRRLSQLVATRWHFSYTALYETGRCVQTGGRWTLPVLIVHEDQYRIGTIGSKESGAWPHSSGVQPGRFLPVIVNPEEKVTHALLVPLSFKRLLDRKHHLYPTRWATLRNNQ